MEETAEKLADLSTGSETISKNAPKEEDPETQGASSKAQKTVSNDDETDPTKYYEKRVAMIASLKASGKDPYPPMWEGTITIGEYIQKFRNIADGDGLTDSITITGRITNKKASSSKLFFYDLSGGGFEVQVMASAGDSELNEAEFSWYHGDYVRPGDIVGISGYPGKSKSGELSIFPRKFVVLAPCLRMWPPQKEGPSADSAALKESMNNYQTRGKIMRYVEKFLGDYGFVQVETPMDMIACRSNVQVLKKCFSPDLYLPVLSGTRFPRVYEIGKLVLSEHMDPLFTTCEVYEKNADYIDMMILTEDLLSGMVRELTGGYKIRYHSNGADKDPVEIDFTPPFRRLDMMDELKTMANLSIPTDLASEEANKYLIDACAKFDVKCPPHQTTTMLLDKLVGHFLEETCLNPTFIINHPEIMSPLAKHNESRPGLAERFQLFINKHESCSGYTQQDDLAVQKSRLARFKEQLKDRPSGDEAIGLIDMLLLYGLPPSATLGLGIDRLAMLLTDSQNIKELFPTMMLQTSWTLALNSEAQPPARTPS